MNQEEKAEYKEQRKQWLDNMFRTPPELDWRLIENANKRAKLEKHTNLVNAYLNSGKASKDKMLETSIGKDGLTGIWIEKGSNNQAGRIHTADIDFSNNLIYAASSGGNIWRGTLTGTDWTCLNNGLQIDNIRNVKVVNWDGKKRIIVTGNNPGTVWYSDNEGLVWNQSKGIDGPPKWGGTYRTVFKYGSNEIYVLCLEWDYTNWKSATSIYYSSDLAENFKLIYLTHSQLEFSDLWTPANDKGPVFYIHKDTLSVISDSTITNRAVIDINHGYGNIGQILMRGSLVDDVTVLSLLLKDTRYDSSHVYQSDDFKTFYYVGSAPVRTFEQNSFNVSFNNPSILFIGGVDLWKSTDNASNWNRINGWGEYYGNPKSKLHADIPGIMNFISDNGNEIYLIGTDGGLYYSNDYLASVNNISLTGLNVSQYYSGYTYRKQPDKIFLGSQDQGFQRCLSDSGGVLNFEQTISGDYGHLSSADGGNLLWSVYPGFALLYEGAQNKSYRNFFWDFKTRMKNYLWMSPIVPLPDDPKSAYLLSGAPIDKSNKQSYIWKLTISNDQIISDTLKFDFGDSTGRRVSAMAISPLNDNLYYAASSNGVFFRSEDKGYSWTKIKLFEGPESHYFYGNTVVASESDPGRVYLAGNGYSTPGAFVSDDFGNNWNPIDSGLPKTMIFRISVTPDDKYIFAATQTGPYVFISDENKWYPLSAPETPDQTYWSVEYIPEIQTARFVTYGRGCWDFKITKFTEVEPSKPEITLKTEMSIFPNPVREKAKLKINSNKTINSEVLLYDIEGRIISKLFNGILSTGTNEIDIDLNRSKTSIGQGNYIIFLIADGLSNYLSIKIAK
jgi:hypothetical protein